MQVWRSSGFRVICVGFSCNSVICKRLRANIYNDWLRISSLKKCWIVSSLSVTSSLHTIRAWVTTLLKGTGSVASWPTSVPTVMTSLLTPQAWTRYTHTQGGSNKQSHLGGWKLDDLLGGWIHVHPQVLVAILVTKNATSISIVWLQVSAPCQFEKPPRQEARGRMWQNIQVSTLRGFLY